MTAQPDGRRAGVGARPPGWGGDYDPAAVPVRDAATVMILSGGDDPHVLMLKRNSRSVFVPDMWVYPGGAVDPHDATPIADDTVAGLSDAEASRRIGTPQGGIAFWVAALRETFEEAGILLAHHRRLAAHTPVKGSPGADASAHAAPADPATAGTAPAAIRSGEMPPRIVDLSPPEVAERFSRYRSQINAGERDFVETVRSEDLRLDGSNVHFIGRWVTPFGAPRRYDTRFFLTAMPQGQVPLPDQSEAVEHRWVRPAEAIEHNRTGAMVMMTPTIGMLHRLARFATVAQAVAAAQRGAPADDEHVRIRFENDGPHRIAFPEDPDYAEADRRTENGMLRWPLT